MNDIEFMSSYEKRIYKGYSKTKADLLKDSKMLSNTVRECLGIEVEHRLEDGTLVNVPVAVELVALKLNYLKDHPKDIDLKELSSVLGENKIEADITLKSANDLFGDIVVAEYDENK